MTIQTKQLRVHMSNGPFIGPSDFPSSTILEAYLLDTGKIIDVGFILADNQPTYVEWDIPHGADRFVSNAWDHFYGRHYDSLEALYKEFGKWLYEYEDMRHPGTTLGDMTMESKKSLQAIAENLVRSLLDDENRSIERELSNYGFEFRDTLERISDLKEILWLLSDLYGNTTGGDFSDSLQQS